MAKYQKSKTIGLLLKNETLLKTDRKYKREKLAQNFN